MPDHKPTFDVLVVEDEAVLAMDIEMMVEDAGHRVIAEAASLQEVVALDGHTCPTLAFVDVQLADDSSGLDVSQLIRRRWPHAFIVFLTANANKIPDDFAGAHRVISKPFSRNGLVSAIRYIEEGLCDPPPRSARPLSFSPAPAVAARWVSNESSRLRLL